MASTFVEKFGAKTILDDINEGAISDRDFNTFRSMIYDEAGISLSEAKRTLVCSRLSKRLRQLGLRTYSDYLQYLETRDPNRTERQVMINCLTTNKTDFFREPHHFDFLTQQLFPKISQAANEGAPRTLRIWSSACSSGEEPYTIAMTILEHFRSVRGWSIEVIASDINTEVIKKAEQGIYSLDRIEGLDSTLKQKYFLRGKGRQAGSCQVVREVRELVSFQQVNLMDAVWPVEGGFDVVFCRNVLIYFNTETQQKLLPRLVDMIKPGGYLMLGHSENLPWLAELMTPIGKTMHQKPSTASSMYGTKLSTGRVSANVTAARTQMAEPSVAPQGQLTHKPKPNSKREIIAGEVFATSEETEIATTLGSCVAVCLYDPVAKVGGMNHFLLPVDSSDKATCGRYGVNAMEILINQIMRIGGDRRRLQAKAFGGSSILAGSSSQVGKTNCDFVRKFLQNEGIPLVAEKLGGAAALRVHFFPHSGTVYVKPVKQANQVAANETQFRKRLAAITKRPNDCTLF